MTGAGAGGDLLLLDGGHVAVAGGHEGEVVIVASEGHAGAVGSQHVDDVVGEWYRTVPTS